MRVNNGDLVRCPACEACPSYFGLVVGVYGYKIDVVGGHQQETWDLQDIQLMVNHNESR